MPKTKTVSLYNRSAQIFRHVLPKEPGQPTEWFVLPAQSQADVPEDIWEHWQKSLAKYQLVNLLVGGSPKDDNQKVTAAVDAKNAAEAKLAAKGKELENLQGLLAKFQADGAQKKR